MNGRAVRLAAPRSKYGAIPLVVDGVRFASSREARRYGELRLLERAGQIWDLTLQPEFPLHAVAAPLDELTRFLTPGAESQQALVGKYRGDFAYATREGTVVEDVKGVRTPLYRWKKKHVEIEYGIRIVEV